jgi:Transcription initiation factor IID, 18kD subunit
MTPSSTQPGTKKPAARPARPATKRKREDGITEPPEPKVSFKGIFAKDLGDIMYGFGDSTSNPVPETVDAVEAIAVNFIKDLLTKCLEHVRTTGWNYFKFKAA